MFAGSNEAPSNGALGTGTAVVSLSGTTLSVLINFSGLSFPATAAHIHCCANPGANAGVVVTLGLTSPYSNAFDYSANLTGLNLLVNGLNAGQAYVNVHTQTLPGGEIRANLTTTVPEPSAYALMAAGLAALGIAARRRRRA